MLYASTSAVFALLILPHSGTPTSQNARPGALSGVSVTIYNQNFALVRERRTIELAQGRNHVAIPDVAALIDPSSVHFRSLTAPKAVVVREQNYRYDLINPTTLLNKSVGKRVTVRESGGAGKPQAVSGTVLASVTSIVAQTANSSGMYGGGLGGGGFGGGYFGGGFGGPSYSYNGLVVRTDDGKILLNPTGEISLHEMPTSLVPRPELDWLVETTQGGRHDTEISYLTDGVTWKADYVALLNNDDTAVDLTGWVTLDNQCGATYENAHLQLVAGDVRRLRPQQQVGGGFGGGGVGGGAGPPVPQFNEEGFFEYHLYTLDGSTTIRHNEQKQMSLLSAEAVPAVKKFVYDGRRSWWRRYYGTYYHPGEAYDTSDQHKINVMVEIRNSKPTMGVPLPKGKVRVYKADSRGGQQFVGEDEIDHTPKDETLRLWVGDSFDAVGEHRRTDFKRLGPFEVEETFEIVLRNHRTEDMNVTVVEHLWSDWEILAKSTVFEKKDAHTVEFPVRVPKDGETKVTYTVRTKW